MSIEPSGSFAKGSAVLTCTLCVRASSMSDKNFEHALPWLLTGRSLATHNYYFLHANRAL
jgi:hypothetical protein